MKFVILEPIMRNRIVFMTVILAAIALILYGCSKPTFWPESPLYEFPESDPGWNRPPDIEAAMQALVGHYAHYDVVAYEDVTTQVPMLTFIISYGFTDLYLENGDL